MIDRGAAFALDHVALGVGVLKDQQLLVQVIGHRCVDNAEALLAETRAVLQHIAADQLEADLVVALDLGSSLV